MVRKKYDNKLDLKKNKEAKKYIDHFMAEVKKLYDDGSICSDILEALLEKNLSIKNLFNIEQRHLEALYAIGYSQFKQGQLSSAQEVFDALICLDHKNLNYLTALGVCFQVRAKYDRAISIYLTMVKQNQKYPMAYIKLCECYFKTTNWLMFNKSLKILEKLDQLGYLNSDQQYRMDILQSKYEVHHLMKVGPERPEKKLVKKDEMVDNHQQQIA